MSTHAEPTSRTGTASGGRRSRRVRTAPTGAVQRLVRLLASALARGGLTVPSRHRARQAVRVRRARASLLALAAAAGLTACEAPVSQASDCDEVLAAPATAEESVVVLASGFDDVVGRSLEAARAWAGHVALARYDAAPGAVDTVAAVHLAGAGPRLYAEANSRERRRCALAVLEDAAASLGGPAPGAALSAVGPALAQARQHTAGPVHVLVHGAGRLVEANLDLTAEDLDLSDPERVERLVVEILDAGLVRIDDPASTRLSFVAVGAGAGDSLAASHRIAFFELLCAGLRDQYPAARCDVAPEAPPLRTGDEHAAAPAR